MKVILIQILTIFAISLIHRCCSSPKDELKMRDYVPHVAQIQDPQKLQEVEQFARKYADSIKFHHETRKDWTSEPISLFTLLPSRIPRKSLDMAHALQPALNLLYFRAASDYEFLQNALGEMAKSDDLVRAMLEVIRDVEAEGGYKRQPIAMTWQRADYMLHMGQNVENDEYQIKQIEVNTQPGGTRMCRLLTKIHREVLDYVGLDSSLEVLRANNPLKMVVGSMYMAWLRFGDPNAVVLTIMGGRGVKDTTQLMFDKISGGKMQFVFMNLDEADEKLKLDPKDFSLRLEDGRPVAIADYRVDPFTRRRPATDKMKRAMYSIERSTAIKRNSLGFLLVGLKKIQQILAKPGMVERFFTDPKEAHLAAAIRQTFAGLWGLDNDDEETRKIIQEAIANPNRYVLKPSKEGGGNNFYGQEMTKKLQELAIEERSSFILMERVNPPIFENYVVEPFKGVRQNPLPRFGKMVTEFSVYGTLMANRVDSTTVLYNHTGAYLMRTKWADSDEGGVLKGTGFYDSAYLY